MNLACKLRGVSPGDFPALSPQISFIKRDSGLPHNIHLLDKLRRATQYTVAVKIPALISNFLSFLPSHFVDMNGSRVLVSWSSSAVADCVNGATPGVSHFSSTTMPKNLVFSVPCISYACCRGQGWEAPLSSSTSRASVEEGCS